MRRFSPFSPLVICISIILFSSCQKEPEIVHVTGVTINRTSLVMVEGETQSLTVVVSPDNADNKAVIWQSSNASVASVDGGKVTAIKEGSATISAMSEDGSITANCQVSVSRKVVAVTGISLSETSKTLAEGGEFTLIATLTPDDATDRSVIWESSAPDVASVDGGKVTAIKEGTATITAKSGDGGASASCEITVITLRNHCISFETEVAEETNSLKILGINANIQYSFDGLSWTDYSEGDQLQFGAGKTLYMRGHDNNTHEIENGIGNFFFVSETKVNCSGNLMTLLDYDSPQLIIKRPYCFSSLFAGCTVLTEVPELPAVQLADRCYCGMFDSCTSLINAPELPATQLADYCYNAMFYACTSLTEVPELPAAQLAYGCYNNMFSGCSSLTEAPELPATQLAGGCYENMFSGCTSLVKAPELPATQLADGCYLYMFSGCEALTAVPNLPAVQLACNCCSGMFNVCTSLTKAPELPSTQLAVGCYSFMFWGCVSLTEVPELPAVELADNCYSCMFENCTSLTEAPGLPAVELADDCYVSMFGNCTSLIKAPGLPAVKLAVNCYSSMFGNCTSLIKAPGLPATNLADGCYSQMFSGCTSLTEAPGLPATQLADGCYTHMFSGCTSLVKAPNLPATKLADGCYWYMFYDCTSLNYVKAMFVDNPDNAASMLSGVSATGTFVKNKAATWENAGVIPDGWTVEYAVQ